MRRGLVPILLTGLVTGVTIALYTLWDTFAVRTWSIPPVAFMVGCALLEVPVHTAARSPTTGGRADAARAIAV